MRRWIACVALLAPGVLGAAPAAEMKVAAEALITALDPQQRQALLLPMDDGQREDFRYTPRERTGLLFRSLDDKQRAAVLQLLQSAMSGKGLLKSRQIMMLEDVLAKREKRPGLRDPEKYWMTIFGTPGDANGWGWKFEGHHLSVNLTLLGDRVALAPSFFGCHPAEVREGEHQGLRILADEEDVARKLAGDLWESGFEEAILRDKPPREILTGEERRVKPLTVVGVAEARMSKQQQSRLRDLIRVYLERYRPELAEAEFAAIEQAGIDKVHFAWAGSLEKGEAWYYRVQGPTFLLEAANSQNQANHIHAVWRKFGGDFGRDLLGEHYRHGHAH